MNSKGFTIIELIVVIAVVAVLASIVLFNINQYIPKSRDARRIADMDQIYKALLIYQSQYGCIPITSGSSCGPAAGTYSQVDRYTWELSSQDNGASSPSFLGFLDTAEIISSVPVDPVNNGDFDTGYAYVYYCYQDDGGNYVGLKLGYWPEINRESSPIWKTIGKPQRNGTIAGGLDPTFICK